MMIVAKIADRTLHHLRDLIEVGAAVESAAAAVVTVNVSVSVSVTAIMNVKEVAIVTEIVVITIEGMSDNLYRRLFHRFHLACCRSISRLYWLPCLILELRTP
jgi:hypothetical protein